MISLLCDSSWRARRRTEAVARAMHGREQQSGDEGEVIDEEAELHRIVREPVRPVEREAEEQDIGRGDDRGFA